MKNHLAKMQIITL